ncbi:murein biosynthesis integral membrane protein MurJ [Streptomyces sp. NBC_00683]|uniref:murein biosynthesis integral membrane protein MurJ n=1 Tax=Streptomyces sp. NBC_00683 TaxID=2903670 RepID=UPI002E32DFA1|nr:murein biosynthesis integral membrane protein MurJ [Streptomyces sp. NBC_00683]
MSTTATAGPTAKQPSALRSGAIMAAGSVVSRATGFLRSAVVAAALGLGIVADGYAVGNSVPTIVYILLLGGALNAVFLPELVRAAKEHADGGAAYTDRLLTLCVLALLLLTGTAVWAAPAIVGFYSDYPPDQHTMTVSLARYCLPQIFFLGLFTLLGQVLNARGRFGAMMWTPVLNNVVVIAVFGLYLATGAGGDLTPGERALLGWGTTAGIVVQALALLPSLRATGFRFRPRFDWRGSGLTRPLRSAGWLVLLVLSNQAAYWVTTRLATSAGARAAAEHIEGAGFSAYNNAYTLWMVPHGIVTVSLVTALMPRMSRSAADGDTAAVRRDAGYALRTSGALIVPAACALLALAHPATALVFQYGRTGPEDIAVLAGILMAFAPGLIAFSGQYVLSRSFYALSDTRTPFLLNLMIAGLNAGLSWASYQLLPARWAVTGMAGGYSLALFAGWALTALVLHRRLTPGKVPGAAPPRPRLWRSATVAAQAGMLVAAVPATLLGLGATRLTAPAGPAVAAGAGALTVAAVFVLLARPLRLAEVDSLVTGAAARLRLRR